MTEPPTPVIAKMAGSGAVSNFCAASFSLRRDGDRLSLCGVVDPICYGDRLRLRPEGVMSSVVKDEAHGIVPGQRYRVTGSTLSVWEVVAIARYPSEPLLHVQLVRVGVPNDRKTVALRVLRDKRYYQLVR